MSKKVLITGGTGYIASHTCVALIEQGVTPILVDDLSNSSKLVLSRIQELTGVLPVFYQGSILDKVLLAKIFAEHPEIEAVMHFAGLKAVGESVEKPLAYYQCNVAGTLNLVEAMQAAGVKQLIFSSSATVYGDPASVPIEESFPTSATNPYGWSKWMVERCLMDFQAAQPDWSITLLRYFNPVGNHPSGRLGEDPQGIPNNLVPYIAQVAIGRREQLSVFGSDYNTPDGTGVRDYIHVVDLAQGHLAALTYASPKAGCHIYNLGTGQGYSVLEMIQAFEKASGRAVPYVLAPRRPGDIAECWATPEKAKRELHWQATRTLDEMARDTWTWQENNPMGYEPQ
ncbi:UDP-glucose 4-epimerase [Vibrio stylophorae]|uniref:UDP-glucose 4-epimerase n=1 Tax=Vibrio stylophorae TaxID=659351 RepID=A0ABM8ZY51_9VIBR|nr:UDP-glucose 4-epimerase GalE [Vibrio stylophorae]CAH0535776.1 UDP-glucose 4-epimerase [Vibrio stylophorae]